MPRPPKWPTVPEVLRQAKEVLLYADRAYYIAGDDQPRVAIHKATLSNLIKALHGAGWTEYEGQCVTRYERPA